MKLLRLKVKGMGCENAINRIEKVKQNIPGVASVSTSLGSEESLIEVEDNVDISKIIGFVEDLDYYVKNYEIKDIVEKWYVKGYSEKLMGCFLNPKGNQKPKVFDFESEINT